MSFLFCGVYTGHAEHTSIVISFSALPWIVWRLDKSVRERRLLPSVQAGAIWGASALCGYPALTLITGCFCALWGLGRLVAPDATRSGGVPDGTPAEEAAGKTGRLGFLTTALMVMAVVGILILLPTYFSFMFEGVGHHTRVGTVEREEAIGANALHPGALATFSSNFLSLLQMRNPDVLWPYTDVSMSSVYGGGLVTLLAVFALAASPGNRWLWWIAVIGVMALACAMGKALPLRGWLCDWFYPMRFFRHTALFRVYYLFVLSVLALCGTRILAISIKEGDGSPWRRFIPVAWVGHPPCRCDLFRQLAAPSRRIWHGRRSEGIPPLLIHGRDALLQGNPWLGPEEAEMVEAMRKLPPMQGISIENLRYTPDEMTFQVECSEDGWLLVTDR